MCNPTDKMAWCSRKYGVTKRGIIRPIQFNVYSLPAHWEFYVLHWKVSLGRSWGPAQFCRPFSHRYSPLCHHGNNRAGIHERPHHCHAFSLHYIPIFEVVIRSRSPKPKRVWLPDSSATHAQCRLSSSSSSSSSSAFKQCSVATLSRRVLCFQFHFSTPKIQMCTQENPAASGKGPAPLLSLCRSSSCHSFPPIHWNGCTYAMRIAATDMPCTSRSLLQDVDPEACSFPDWVVQTKERLGMSLKAIEKATSNKAGSPLVQWNSRHTADAIDIYSQLRGRPPYSGSGLSPSWGGGSRRAPRHFGGALDAAGGSGGAC